MPPVFGTGVALAESLVVLGDGERDSGGPVAQRQQ